MKHQTMLAARITTPLLVLYWLVMFAGTHYPQIPSMGFEYADKIVHLVGFAGLGFLLAASWVRGRPLTLLRFVAIFAVLAGYGALDELSQPLVDRACELFDWYADALGALLGILLFVAVRPLWRRWRAPNAGGRPLPKSSGAALELVVPRRVETR